METIKENETLKPGSDKLVGKNLTPRKPSELEAKVNKVLVESGCLRTSMINFLLVYNVRFGIALLGRVLTLFRTSPKSLLSLSEILSEQHLHFREEAVRMGLFAGSFTGMYIAMKRILRGGFSSGTEEHQQEWWHPFVSGFVAGLSLLWMDKSWHRTLALYMLTRASQCYYNFSKQRGYFHFWGSSWSHGDSLLFGLSSAQIMYSYVMRPSALPPSYYAFIRKQGPLPEVLLQAVRDNCRSKPVDVEAVTKFVTERAKGNASVVQDVLKFFPNNTPFPKLIPSLAMHPYTRYPIVHAAYAFKNVAVQIFPVYFTLAIVPKIVLSFQKFIKHPGSILLHSISSAIQSTIFLSSFCGGYAAFIGWVRKFQEGLGLKDHKLWYYIAGLFASFSILFEQKNRRSELALYAFPRAADALYSVLYDAELIVSVPQGELLMFCVAMGLCLFFHENDRKTLSPLFARLIERFLPDDVLRSQGDKRNLVKTHSQYEFGELRSDTPMSTELYPSSPSNEQMLSMGGSSLVN